MSWKVVVKKIDAIFPHPNADKLELIKIGGWQLVVPKTKNYSVGELVAYFPADSIIPEKWLEEWDLLGKLSGKRKDRVKPCRLRGESSIGLTAHAPEGASEGDDVQEYFGVARYEAPIPVELKGRVRNRPPTFQKYDIENINNVNDLVVGEHISVTEKIHGTNAAYGFVDGEFYVCSRNLCLEDEGQNVYWRMAKKYNIENILRQLSELLIEPSVLWIHGEIFGKGVQDLQYGTQEPEFRFFDLRVNNEFVNNNIDKYFVDPMEAWLVMMDHIKSVPAIYSGEFISMDHLKQFVSGKDLINDDNIREGIVIKCIDKPRNEKGERRIYKLVSEEYLFRKNGTEYH